MAQSTLFLHPSAQVMDAYKQMQAAADNFGNKVAAYEKALIHAQNLHYHMHSDVWCIYISKN